MLFSMIVSGMNYTNAILTILFLVIVFFNVGYNSKNGIASVCLHTLAPISLVIGKSEIEFIKEIDDPKGDETDPAKRILAVPIMPTQDNMFTMPKGVIIAVNTFDGKDFDPESIDNLCSYSSLIAKVFSYTE